MAECWANFTNTCAGGMSREHIIPRVLHGENSKVSKARKVIVVRQGYPGAMEVPQEVPLSSAGVRILCKKHNSELGKLDAEVGKIRKAVQTNGRLLTGRQDITDVRAELLTRWLCKTHCNHTAVNRMPLNRAIACRALGCPGGDPVSVFAIITSEENVSRNRDKTIHFRPYFHYDGDQLSITRIFGHAFLLASASEIVADIVTLASVFWRDQEVSDWLSTCHNGIHLLPPPCEITLSGKSPYAEALRIGEIVQHGAGNVISSSDRPSLGPTFRIA
jgi:hypothetical protein